VPKPNLVVIVEGQTETSALTAMLSSHLSARELTTIFPLIGTSNGKKGGQKSFETLLEEISFFAKNYQGVHISTCFDYYGLNTNWPEVTKIKNQAIDVYHKVANIETVILEKVITNISSNILYNDHFHPYIQLHEFEALLFADPEILARELCPKKIGYDLVNCFRKIVNLYQNNCELINDHKKTAPSKRIIAVAQYKKGKTGLAKKILPIIGLDKIRNACPHFSAWINKLENLSPSI
jgi:hypothetical protein